MEIKSCPDDTRALLRECSAGAQMAVESIDRMMPKVRDDRLRQVMTSCRRDHEKYRTDAARLLESYGESENAPPAVARAMSRVKISMKLMGDKADAGAAEITYKGCATGICTLSKCMNKNAGADSSAESIAHDILKCEERTMESVRRFL